MLGQSRTVFSLLPVIFRPRMADTRYFSRSSYTGGASPTGASSSGPTARSTGWAPWCWSSPCEGCGTATSASGSFRSRPCSSSRRPGHRDGDRAHRQLRHGIHDGRLDVGLPRVPAEFSGADRAQSERPVWARRPRYPPPSPAVAGASGAQAARQSPRPPERFPRGADAFGRRRDLLLRRIPEGAVRDAAGANKKEPYETYRMRTVRSPECINMVVSVFVFATERQRTLLGAFV